MSYRLLVVDDDDLVHMTIDLIFEDSSEFSIKHAKTGTQALEIIKADPHFDLVIMDYQMPQMTGAEVTKELLKIKKDLKVIINSGEVPSTIQSECLASGVAGFIEKNNPDMLNKIKKFLSP